MASHIAHMAHNGPKGRTVSPFCASQGQPVTCRGKTQKMNNCRSRCNRSLAENVCYATAELFPLFGFRKRAPGVVRTTTVTYGYLVS